MKRWLLSLAVFAAFPAAIPAQITKDVTLVNIVATVTDANGHFVRDLDLYDFSVTEDGREQKIALVEQSDDLPLSIGVLIDTSTSMSPKIETATAAVERFLRALGRDDDMFLMSFAAQPKLEQNFTNDRDKMTKALKRLKLSNQTALYDALDQGLLKVRDGKHPRKAILLVTDGQDTVSRIGLMQLTDDVRESRVTVYCLGIGSSYQSRRSGPSTTGGQPPSRGPEVGRGQTPTITLPGGIQIPIPGPVRRQFPSSGPQPGNYPDSVNMSILHTIASASGGKAFQVTTNSFKTDSIDAVLDEIAAELRSQYTIGYYPDHPANDGEWHQVSVRTQNPRFEVRSRKEYFGAK